MEKDAAEKMIGVTMNDAMAQTPFTELIEQANRCQYPAPTEPPRLDPRTGREIVVLDGPGSHPIYEREPEEPATP